jgi:hypothetical protein
MNERRRADQERVSAGIGVVVTSGRGAIVVYKLRAGDDT